MSEITSARMQSDRAQNDTRPNHRVYRHLHNEGNRRIQIQTEASGTVLSVFIVGAEASSLRV